MKSFDARFLGFAALILSGCASFSRPSTVLDIPADRAPSCPEWRWVALKPEGAAECPVPSPNWRVRPLFPSSERSPERSPSEADRQAILSRLCLYESTRKGRIGDEIRRLALDRKLEAIYPDCAMMGSLADPGLAEQSWEKLQDHLFTQVDKPAVLMEGRKPSSVRLAILDTQPLELWDNRVSGNSPHGWFVAHLGHRLVCDDTMEDPESDFCTAEVTTRLALPLKKLNRRNPGKTERDELRGGYFGSVLDVTEAVRWELAKHQRSKEQLILNLSLGWEGTPEELSGPVQNMPGLVQGLYYLLEEAACQGVLVIAAAGNRVGGPGPETGMLLPAAWANRPAMCGGDPNSQPPLIYAVGGVDSEGDPLSNAREKGTPELVAFADHAVVQTCPSGEPTKTYTGSSVAAAVASAAAAVVWNEHPGWTAREVMETLYDTGCELPYEADVVANPPLGSSPGGSQLASLEVTDLALDLDSPRTCGSSPCVRRIFLGRALGQASTSQHRLASLTAQRSCPSLGPPDLQTHLDAKHEVNVPAQSEMSVKTLSDCPEKKIEVPSGTRLTPELVSTLCATGKVKAAMQNPWARPQPDDPPCPNCTLEPQGTGGGFTGAYTLYIEIDKDWPAKLTLHNPTLWIDGTAWPLSSFPVSSTSSSSDVLNTGDTMTVTNIPGDRVKGAKRIVLQFTTDDGLVENPVLVTR
jgi:hypothetical protein